jgi:hypothetical protein
LPQETEKSFNHLASFEGDVLTYEALGTLPKTSQLVKAGLERIPEFEGCKLFRKRK